MVDQKQALIDEAKEISEEAGTLLNEALKKLNDPSYDLGVLTTLSSSNNEVKRKATVIDIIELVQSRLEVIGIPNDNLKENNND